MLPLRCNLALSWSAIGISGGNAGDFIACHWDGSSLEELEILPNIFNRINQVQDVDAAAPDDIWAVGYGRNITEPFHADSEVGYVASFTGGFAEAFGTSPGQLAALSYDAANLALVQLANGLHSRSSLRQALLDVRAYPGVSGITTMRSDGTAQKRPYLLGVEKRKIRAID